MTRSEQISALQMNPGRVITPVLTFVAGLFMFAGLAVKRLRSKLDELNDRLTQLEEREKPPARSISATR